MGNQVDFVSQTDYSLIKFNEWPWENGQATGMGVHDIPQSFSPKGSAKRMNNTRNIAAVHKRPNFETLGGEDALKGHCF